MYNIIIDAYAYNALTDKCQASHSRSTPKGELMVEDGQNNCMENNMWICKAKETYIWKIMLATVETVVQNSVM